MAGIQFQSWEHFLHYVQKKERIVQIPEWSNDSELFDADYLEADEWDGLQKMLSSDDYEELTGKRRTIEVRSFRISEENNWMIFYAAGEDIGDGRYLCMGYGIVSEKANVEDKNNHFTPMPDKQSREKPFYYIGTEQDYWDNYPILQMDLPEEILEYLASQIVILDSNYGADRDVQGGMGGFCAVIPKLNEAAKKAYRQIL